jgi:GT2 family glycosyltransferase
VAGSRQRSQHVTHDLARLVSVVVITRNRPRELEVCLRSVLASSFSNFELVVVDQSAQSTSETIVARFAAQDRRVRLVRDNGTGAARARNIGARETTGEIVVFTDDDCEVANDWLGLIVKSLSEDPQVGIAYGSVIPAPHDKRTGFIVGFLPKRRLRLTGRLSKLRDKGISANVALRRSALEATGGFDEMLGPGSYFACAEDLDLTYRVLSKGCALLHVPEARVVHHGLRDFRTGRTLVHGTYVAIGAAYMKHVRARDLVGIVFLLFEIGLALINIARNLGKRRGPFGFGRLGALVVGMWRSFELKVDPLRPLYGPASIAAAGHVPESVLTQAGSARGSTASPSTSSALRATTKP